MYSPEISAHAWGKPPVSGVIRNEPQDFQVIEIPAFSPSGEGEHRILHIRKTCMNTAQVGDAIARLAKLPKSRVSWAGLKDRNAVTEQWFSVHIANKPEPDWNDLNTDRVRVLEVHRHRKKLRRGVLKANQFYIRLAQMHGDLQVLKDRYETILDHGVPNYFGQQRFGFRGGNIGKALAMFRAPHRRIKRHERGLYLSAARSLLFNAVLDRRVREGSWNQLLPGDVCQLNGSQSTFPGDAEDEDLLRRLREFDIHPTGPLWGKGHNECQLACRQLEQEIITEHQEFADGLVQAGMKLERRALRVEPRFFQMQLEKDSVSFSFELPPGSYATSVLREMALFIS